MTMSRLRSWVFVVALLMGAELSVAQQPGDAGAFSVLRADGNGVAALRVATSLGFIGVPADAAIQSLATIGHLNVTYDPALGGLRARLAIKPHERSVATALMEIGQASGLRVRVSSAGDVVIDPAPRASAPRPVASSDTTTRPLVGLPAMSVQGARAERLEFEQTINPAAYRMSAEALRSVPSFVEPDVLRSVQLMPGVETRSDWTAGFNVHGGEADQTLILLDGYPIYSPFHLGGLFSTFISSAVGQIALYSGALPVRFGGRLSGVLDVTSAVPASSEVHGSADVSLVSASTSFGRTFADGAGAWQFGARRTYADAAVNVFRPGTLPYHFRDLQAHVTRQFGEHTSIALTAFAGEDVIGRTAGGSANQTTGGWSNQVLGATLARSFVDSPRLVGITLGDSVAFTQRVSLTRFNADVVSPDYAAGAGNDVRDIRASGTLTVHRATSATSIGYELAKQRFSYFAASVNPQFGDFLPLDSLAQHARSAGLFASQAWRATPALLLEVGARLDAVENVRGAFVAPRASLKYFLTPDMALTAAGGRYGQWVHSLGRQEEPVEPLQFWVLSDSLRPASSVRDVALGLERWVTPARLIHVGTFYKRYDDLLIPNAQSDPTVKGDSFAEVAGNSYGVDFLLRQVRGERFTGWLSYAFSVSTRVDSAGYHYAPAQDRRHNLNLVGSWRAPSYTLGAHLGIATGLPTTPVTGGFISRRYDPDAGLWAPGSGPTGAIVAPLNSDRLPFYERIDVSVRRAGRLFGMPVSPYLSILNVLNARNPMAYQYSPDPLRRQYLPNFPILPTFGVNAVF